jgi:ABC-type sugar transport system substrate-binding protein
MKNHRSLPPRALTVAVGLFVGTAGAVVASGVAATPSSAAPSYSWSSISPARTQSELSSIGLGQVNYGIFKGKSVGVVELAPIEPVTRIETDFDKCVTANGGTIKLVDTGGDPTKGVATVQNFLQEKVAGIWNDALDPTTIVPEITTANRTRVPLITAWSGASATSVGVNGLEMQSAARLAQYVIDRLGGTGQVVMLGSTATQSLRERDAAFTAVAKQYPGIKIVADQSVNVASPTEDANSALKAILQANPNIGAVWTDFDEIGVGAAQALQAAGSKAFVVGFNGDKQALADIRNPSNPYAATMANDLEVSGDVGCAEMATMLAGGEPPARNIYMDSPIVTKANIGSDGPGYVHGTGPFLIYTEPLAQRWPKS